MSREVHACPICRAIPVEHMVRKEVPAFNGILRHRKVAEYSLQYVCMNCQLIKGQIETGSESEMEYLRARALLTYNAEAERVGNLILENYEPLKCKEGEERCIQSSQ